MNTLMKPDTFAELKCIRNSVLRDLTAYGSAFRPAGVFVPWVGSYLVDQGGIYYVGIATDAGYATKQQSLRHCYEEAARMCDNCRHDRSHTPFWRFLDGLTVKLLGAPFHETSDRWGWSNLLKIGATEGTPGAWPSKFVELQRTACIRSLRQELSQLEHALVFVASGDDLGILPNALREDMDWDRSYETAGIWWKRHANSIVIQGYHPRYAQTQGFFDDQLKATVNVARRELAWATG